MRSTKVSAAAFLLSFVVLAEAQVTNEQLLDEIRALREEVESLRGEVESLKEASESELDLRPSHNFEPQGADREKLSEIELPEDPTRKQVEKYIDAILDLSSEQNSFSTDDPQVRMLAKVGSENADLLIESMVGGFHMTSSIYGVEALNSIVTDKHKDLVLKRMSFSHELVKVALNQGWTRDARDTLLNELDAQTPWLPEEWIQAVAEFEDPSTYELLTNYLARSHNPANVYQVIEPLEGIELEEAVKERWQSFGRHDGFGRQSFAGIAASYGHKDALETLVDLLDTGDSHYWSPLGTIRQQLMRVVDTRGSNAEIEAWFEANKDKLVFDAEARKFVLPEG